MNWTWLGLAVLVLLAFSMVDGYRHGFVKEVVSALLVLISVALVWLINPYVNPVSYTHLAATNEALRQVESESAAVMSKLTGGLGGLGGGLPF